MELLALDQIVLIFGGTSGIGLATGIEYVRRGARYVFLVGRDRSRFESYTTQKLYQSGIDVGKIRYVQGDVRIPESVRSIISTIHDQYGHISVFFNNAGVVDSKDGDLTAPKFRDIRHVANNLEYTTRYESGTSTFRYTEDAILTNMVGIVNCLNAELSYIRDKYSGMTTSLVCIINTSSETAKSPDKSIPVYSATKAAVSSLTESIAAQVGKEISPLRGYPTVRINAILPGPVYTPLLVQSSVNSREQAFGVMENPETLNNMNREFGKYSNLGRIGSAQEIANVVVFLSSNLASYIHGALISIDGGSR